MNNSEKRKGFTLLEAGLMVALVAGIVWFGYARMNRMREERMERSEEKVIEIMDTGFTLLLALNINFQAYDPATTNYLKHKGAESGYEFKIHTIQNKNSIESYGVVVPFIYGKTGKRTFYLDNTGVIRGSDNNGQAADVSVMKTWPIVTVGDER